MTKIYDYVLAVWLRLRSETSSNELREYFETSYLLHKFRVIEGSDDTEGSEFSLQVQTSFQEHQMKCDEPTEAAVAEFGRELRTYVEEKYSVDSLDVLDDALTSFLLNISEQ